NLVEENRPEASVLPGVLHDERDLDRVLLVERIVPSYGDERGAPGARHDERETPLVVHGGQYRRPVGREPLHDREEPLVGRLEAQATVERLQSRRVVRTDGPNMDDGAVLESELVLELGRIALGKRHRVVIL